MLSLLLRIRASRWVGARDDCEPSGRRIYALQVQVCNDVTNMNWQLVSGIVALEAYDAKRKALASLAIAWFAYEDRFSHMSKRELRQDYQMRTHLLLPDDLFPDV